MRSNPYGRPQLPGPNIARQATAWLYSCNKLLSSPTGTLSYFATGVGGTGQGFGSTPLTQTETNLPSGGRIPDQQRWVIRELGFYVTSANVATDVSLIMHMGNLSLVKPDYQYFYGIPAFWPAGFGLYSATTTVGTNGFAARTARNMLKVPIVMDPGETFQWNLTITAAPSLTATALTWLCLYGENVNSIVQ